MKKLDISLRAIHDKVVRLGAAVVLDKSNGDGVSIKTALVNHTPKLIVAGPAYIVQSKGNILPVLKALRDVPEYHVLVINVADREARKAILGDIVMTAAQCQNLAGLVVFGNIRDTAQAAEIGIPVWSLGVEVEASVLGDDLGVELESLDVSGSVIRRGDYLVGDRDGLISIKAESLRHVLKAAEIKHKKETIFVEKLKQGVRLADEIGMEAYLSGDSQLTIDF